MLYRQRTMGECGPTSNLVISLGKGWQFVIGQKEAAKNLSQESGKVAGGRTVPEPKPQFH